MPEPKKVENFNSFKVLLESKNKGFEIECNNNFLPKKEEGNPRAKGVSFISV